MRKLKKFVLNDNRVLSDKELASVEGSFSFNGPDTCTPSTKGDLCILATGYDNGHTTVTFGNCAVEVIQQGGKIIEIASCK